MASAEVSDEKKSPCYIKGKCYNDCEVTLTVGEEKTELYVCKDHLAKLSDYFRAMFFGNFKEKNQMKFQIEDETPDNIVCFLNAIHSDPDVQKITDDSVELLIRLAEKYQCDLLKKCLKNHIEVNVGNCTSSTLNWLSCCFQYNMPEEVIKICLNEFENMWLYDSIEFLMSLADQYKCDLLKGRLVQYIEANETNCKSPGTILNWLLLSWQYHMPEEFVKLCLPGVACLSSSTLYANDEKIGWELVAKLLDSKMRLIFKANELISMNIIYSTISCCLCHFPMPKNRFPYRIQWCAANESMLNFRCWNCSKNNNTHYCEKCQFYYKCSRCELDLSSYKNKDEDQCLCARKNHEIMLNEMS